jgi:hypothetical protein
VSCPLSPVGGCPPESKGTAEPRTRHWARGPWAPQARGSLAPHQFPATVLADVRLGLRLRLGSTALCSRSAIDAAVGCGAPLGVRPSARCRGHPENRAISSRSTAPQRSAEPR